MRSRPRSQRAAHCVGPLGPGSLILKPIRHVTAVRDLTDEEAAELGPLLRLVSQVASQLVAAEQVYNCLWSHAGGVAGHIHFVVQPVTQAQMQHHGAYGPALQMAMFSAGSVPALTEVERTANQARELVAASAR